MDAKRVKVTLLVVDAGDDTVLVLKQLPDAQLVNYHESRGVARGYRGMTAPGELCPTGARGLQLSLTWTDEREYTEYQDFLTGRSVDLTARAIPAVPPLCNCGQLRLEPGVTSVKSVSGRHTSVPGSHCLTTAEVLEESLKRAAAREQELRACLCEWRKTPYFEDEGEWQSWRDRLAARVDALLASNTEGTPPVPGHK